MKIINKTLAIISFFVLAANVFGQSKAKIITIQAKDLDLKSVRTGKSSYLVYTKKSKQSGAENLYIANVNVESKLYDGKPSYSITQVWERGEIPFHKAHTILSALDGTTLWHETYWERTGMTLKFDFANKKISYEGKPNEEFKPQFAEYKKKTEADFQGSFSSYNLNWHSDLIIFSMLPFKENRIIKVNWFDPGSTESQFASYTVKGSEIIIGSAGERIDCWVVEHKPEKFDGLQKFWISKETKEVLKEEDFFNNSYRFKLKLKTAEAN